MINSLKNIYWRSKKQKQVGLNSGGDGGTATGRVKKRRKAGDRNRGKTSKTGEGTVHGGKNTVPSPVFPMYRELR